MTDVTDTTDAELLRLGAELTLRMSIEQKIADLDVTEETDARFKAVREKRSALIARIATAPATTLAGLRVKAQAIAWFDFDDWAPRVVEDCEQQLLEQSTAGWIALA